MFRKLAPAFGVLHPDGARRLLHDVDSTLDSSDPVPQDGKSLEDRLLKTVNRARPREASPGQSPRSLPNL